LARLKQWTALLLLAGAALVRLEASFDGFWFDEIWSLDLARAVPSPLAIFTDIHESNNNHLNTLFLFLLGAQSHWVVYRLPAVLAGIGTVWLAGRIGGRCGRLERLLAMLLTAASYLLIHYASEARGYELAVFFDLLAFDFLETYFTVGGRWRVMGFWAASVLSLLSHLMFVLVYPAFFVWSWVCLIRRGRGWRYVMRVLAFCHAVPLAGFVLLYVVDVRFLVIGGAPEYSLLRVLLETLALALGAPATGRLAIAGAIASIVLALTGIVVLRQVGSDRWILYLLAILVVPALFAAARPQALFVRYFLGAVAFFLVLLAELLARMLRRGALSSLTALVLLSLLLTGNAWHTGQLLRAGRGDYLGALLYMAEYTPGPTITVGSDHDFRNRLVLGYYTKYLGQRKELVYYDQGTWPPQGPDWLLLHRIDNDRTAPPEALEKSGHVYRLVKHVSHAALSGWDWYVYHKLDAARGTAADRSAPR
jgi:hypothetical protein